MNEKMQRVIEEIKTGNRKNLYDLNFFVEEYLSKSIDSISFLEYLLKNDISLNYKDEKNLLQNLE